MCDYLGYQRYGNDYCREHVANGEEFLRIVLSPHSITFRPTIFLAIRLMDRVIARLNLEGEKRILTIACACLTLAIKFEEVQHDSLSLFSAASGGVFTVKDLQEAEMKVTGCLNFEMVSISALHFEERLCCAAGCDERQREFVKYLTELTLLDARLLKMAPSVQVRS